MAEDSMSENKGVMGQLGDAARNNPAIDRLREEASGYLQARGRDLAKNLSGRLEDATDRMQDAADGGGLLARTAKEGAKSAAKGDNPLKGAAKGAVGGLKDKVKGALGGGGSGSADKATVIIEEIDVGAPVSVVYNQWTQYQDYAGFMKKVEHADQDEDDDEVKVDFKAQVFWSHRRWQATIEEQVPDERITWRSEGEKGHVDGTVTFHELAPRLTRVLVVLEYYPQGLFERTGNLWRAQGRRARLELKHFRRHVMMNVMHEPEQLEGWRGEVHDEELTRSHDEVVEEEQGEGAEEPEAEGDYDEEEPEAEEEDYEEQPEGEYDEEPEEGEYEEEPEGEYDEEPEEGEYEEEPEAEEEDYEEEPEEEEPPPRRRRRAS